MKPLDLLTIYKRLGKPASPEEIEQNDVVVGEIRLGTRVSVLCVFKILDKDNTTKREVVCVNIYQKAYGNGREIWTEAATDLIKRFGTILSGSTQMRLDGLLRFTLLDEKDPLRSQEPPTTGNYAADMMSLYYMPIEKFDAIYIASPDIAGLDGIKTNIEA